MGTPTQRELEELLEQFRQWQRDHAAQADDKRAQEPAGSEPADSAP